jgi:uncharacterized membrane protein YfhO
MGYASQTHWSTYKGGNPVNDSLLGVKYIVDTKAGKVPSLYYDRHSTSMKYVVYKNPYAMSLAYGVADEALSFDMTLEKSHLERLNLLVGAMLGSSESSEIFYPVETESIEHNNCDRSYTDRHISFIKKNESAATVSITTHATADGELFFFAPSDYTRPVKLAVNGTSKGTYFDGESDRIISLGIFKAGDKVTVKLTLEESADLYLLDNCDYFYHINTEKLDECMTALKNNPQFIVDDDCPDNHLTGTIKTEKDDQAILTTIPYDEGWKIYVDGVRVDIQKSLDALISFNIASSGEHTLEMKYIPTAHLLGAVISLLGIAVFAIMCIGEFLIKKVFKSRIKHTDDVLWVLEDIEEDEENLSEYPPLPKKEFSVKKLLEIFNKKTNTVETQENDDNVDNDNNGGN